MCKTFTTKLSTQYYFVWLALISEISFRFSLIYTRKRNLRLSNLSHFIMNIVWSRIKYGSFKTIKKIKTEKSRIKVRFVLMDILWESNNYGILMFTKNNSGSPCPDENIVWLTGPKSWAGMVYVISGENSVFVSRLSNLIFIKRMLTVLWRTKLKNFDCCEIFA